MISPHIFYYINEIINFGLIFFFFIKKVNLIICLTFEVHFICQFEPTNKNSNPRGFLQSAQPYSSKSQFENGRRAPQFELFVKISQVEHENEKVEPEIGKTETANENVETQNKKRGRPKAQNKKSTLAIQRFSNHIKFIDYIPTHEIITYRHLFAYGFYVE